MTRWSAEREEDYGQEFIRSEATSFAAIAGLARDASRKSKDREGVYEPPLSRAMIRTGEEDLRRSRCRRRRRFPRRPRDTSAPPRKARRRRPRMSAKQLRHHWRSTARPERLRLEWSRFDRGATDEAGGVGVRKRPGRRDRARNIDGDQARRLAASAKLCSTALDRARMAVNDRRRVSLRRRVHRRRAAT